MAWTGLHWPGLACIGLDRPGPACMAWTGLHWPGPAWTAWTGLHGLDRPGPACMAWGPPQATTSSAEAGPGCFRPARTLALRPGLRRPAWRPCRWRTLLSLLHSPLPRCGFLPTSESEGVPWLLPGAGLLSRASPEPTEADGRWTSQLLLGYQGLPRPPPTRQGGWDENSHLLLEQEQR